MCLRGHVIVDQTNHLPSKGAFLVDEDDEAAWGKFSAFCAELVQARENGRQKEYITQRFGEEYPLDLQLEDIISDSLGSLRAVFGHRMYECEQCGRLWLQPIASKNHSISYLPETVERGILRSDKNKMQQ